MKNEDLFKHMSLIHDEYIEETESLNNKSLKERFSFRIAGTVAACICFVISIFLFSFYFNSTKNHTNDDTSRETSAIIETNKTNDDFVLKNGVLISYCGEDTDIIIPDEVTEITDESFRKSPVYTEITSIHLGRNVEKISKKSFVELTSLKKITVDEKNSNYISENGFLAKRDGSVCFGMVASHIDAIAFSNAIEKMKNDLNTFGETTEFVFGNAVIKIKFETYVDSFGSTTNCYAESASAYGHEIVFEEALRLIGNFLIYIYHADDTFVISRITGGICNNWFFREEGIYSHTENRSPSTQEETGLWYNESMYTFEYREDGKIGYKRTPLKYLTKHEGFQQIKYCVSLDEFGQEEGYVTFENGVIKYHPEKTYRVSEILDVQYYFDVWHEYMLSIGEEYYEIGNYPKVYSLEELLQYNSERYEAAE